jgi:fructose-bisphosphate aldolase class 1
MPDNQTEIPPDIDTIARNLQIMSTLAENQQLKARIAEFSQAVGLITTLKPTMVMDANHPLDMVREVAEHVTARIAELEGKFDQLTAHSDIERQDDKWIPEVQE